ncbi:MAG: hypothetical protein F4151_12350 [Gammaproteobacteria bacterium]|nr:hypothetical protein [Boseongicola sp. SB0667_bin_21]MYH50286.1 hypothetical protein [Gammaproteobacteria bacterium]MYI70289.1 hypothetical protein [Boseongicola sp. SB0673_bin_14]
MSLTLEELQKAGASPELARILADRLPRRTPGDLTRNPMAVTLSGIALAAFLSTLGWLVIGMSDLQSDVVRLDERMSGVEMRMTALEDRMTALEDRITGIETRMAGIEEKLDRLLQE